MKSPSRLAQQNHSAPAQSVRADPLANQSIVPRTMTAARPKRKRLSADVRALAAVVVALAAALNVPRAGATEPVVSDWRSGLAIGGDDPVAFFTEGKPLAGSADLELRYAGTIWRFRNPGNRAAFAERPNVYMPQYGGYDPLGVARGVAVAGNPNVWLIFGERLYLFYDRARLQEFTANPGRVIVAANHRWPDVAHTLSP